MSDANHEHETAIKTPKQLIAVIVASFLIPILIIALLANYYVGTLQKEAAGSDALAPEATAERIKPVAQLEIKDPNAPKVLKTGETVYKEVCAACHTAGAAGAPKFGDAAAWAPRLAQGYEVLLKSALNGKGIMAAKGGNSDLDDIEVARAVVYITTAAGGKFKEPEVKTPSVAAESKPAAVDTAASDAAALVAAAKSASPVAASEPKPAADQGKKIYESVCVSCHAAGVAGAPKLGDKEAWAPRIKQGLETLYASALKGKGIMPAKGGSGAADDDIKAAVRYMAETAK